jgi:hypothetical protein
VNDIPALLGLGVQHQESASTSAGNLSALRTRTLGSAVPSVDFRV